MSTSLQPSVSDNATAAGMVDWTLGRQGRLALIAGVGFCGPEGGHAVVSSAGGMAITAAAPAVAFHRQIQAVEADAAAAGKELSC